MHITYDRKANAAYISLTDEDLPPGRVSVPVEDSQGAYSVICDFKDGKLVGVEVLGASDTLAPDLLAAAEIIDE